MNSLRVEGQRPSESRSATVRLEAPTCITFRGNLQRVGAGQRLLMMRDWVDPKLPRIVVAQAEGPTHSTESTSGSLPRSNHPGPENPGPGIQWHPLAREKGHPVLRHFDGVVEQCSRIELADAAVGDKTGMFTARHTGRGLGRPDSSC